MREAQQLSSVFKIPYLKDIIAKLRCQQAENLQNRENENIHNVRLDEAQYRKYKRLKLGGEV